MKCKNCGAELYNGKCEYCGTNYNEDMRSYMRKRLSEANLYMICNPLEPRVEILDVSCLGDSEPLYIMGVEHV